MNKNKLYKKLLHLSVAELLYIYNNIDNIILKQDGGMRYVPKLFKRTITYLIRT